MFSNDDLKCLDPEYFSIITTDALIDKIEVFKDKRVKVHFIYSGKEIRELKGGGRS